MVKGRQGLYLEAWKFSVYLIVPVVASIWFSNPDRQKKAVDYWRFISYPANPNTNLRKQVQELQEEYREQQKQRKQYQEQLAILQQAAEKSEERIREAKDKNETPSSWRRWLGWKQR